MGDLWSLPERGGRVAQLTLRALLLVLLAPGLALAQEAASEAPPAAPAPQAGAARAGTTPTEQLFDAIAVGQIDAVRDAIGRGANVNARNVLGQRPVDLAIDVGRSDIAFLLLSLMRAGQPDRGSGLPAETAPTRQAPRTAGARATATPVAPPVPARFATRWADDGGAPQPEIGFLGFDASRPEGSRPPAAVRPVGARPAQRNVRRAPLGD